MSGSYKNDKNYIRDIFDEISLSLINFLENHEGVTNVQFFEIGGCNEDDFKRWEKKNSPYQIPEDFKSFLGISDGLLLRWNIQLNNQNVPLGNMHVNSLENVVKKEYSIFTKKKSSHTAFCIDTSTSGTVAFIYETKYDRDPKIFFQDLGGDWHFLCHTFMEYFRLMVLHMGIPNWQYAFTDIGLDRITSVWLGFLTPKRQEIDQIGRRTRLLFQKERQKQKRKKEEFSKKKRKETEPENEGEEEEDDDEDSKKKKEEEEEEGEGSHHHHHTIIDIEDEDTIRFVTNSFSTTTTETKPVSSIHQRRTRISSSSQKRNAHNRPKSSGSKRKGGVGSSTTTTTTSSSSSSSPNQQQKLIGINVKKLVDNISKRKKIVMQQAHARHTSSSSGGGGGDSSSNNNPNDRDNGGGSSSSSSTRTKKVRASTRSSAGKSGSGRYGHGRYGSSSSRKY